jgi:hypothetical protein
MANAKDVLQELESIGAVGPEEPFKLSVDQIELIERPPTVPPMPVDVQSSAMSRELVALAESLRRIALEAETAAEACERLATTAVHIGAVAHEELAVLEEPSGLRVVQPRTPYSEFPPSIESPPPEHIDRKLSPDDIERAREMVRRKVRGEHLSEAERTELMGEGAPIMREDPDAPAISLPALTPSYPPEENEDGQVPEEG